MHIKGEKNREKELLRQEVREKRDTPRLPNILLNMGAIHPRERAVELQTLTRFKAKFQNNLQLWDLFISGVGLLILAYLAL